MCGKITSFCLVTLSCSIEICNKVKFVLKCSAFLIPGCELDCDLDKFYKVIQPMLYEGDWFKECANVDTNPPHSNSKYILSNLKFITFLRRCSSLKASRKDMFFFAASSMLTSHSDQTA